MGETAIRPDIATLSFEEALEELDGIVRQLEAGRFRLDDAIGAYERGARLKAHCEARLSEAKAKVEKIQLNADGTIGTETVTLDK